MPNDRLFLVAAVLAATLALPAATAIHSGAGLHDTDPQDQGDVSMTLWTHCNLGGSDVADDDPNDGFNDRCGSHRWLDGKAGRSDPRQDQGSSVDVTTSETFTYSFETPSEGIDYRWSRPFALDEASAALYLTGTGQWTFHVDLETWDDAGSTVVAEGESTINFASPGSGGINTFDLSLADDPVVLPEGRSLRLVVTADGGGPTASWSVWHHRSDGSAGQSRIQVNGELVVKHAWTNDENDVPRNAFPLADEDAKRKLQATYVVESAFGAEGLRATGSWLATFEGVGQVSKTLDHNPAKSSQSRAVYTLDTPWSYPVDSESGPYEATYRLRTNNGDTRLETTSDFSLGTGVTLDVVGDSILEVRRGENATFTVEIDNIATSDLDVQLGADRPGAAWDVEIRPIRTVIPQDRTERVDLVVRPGQAVPVGTRENITLQAEAVGRPDLEPVTVDVTVEVTDETRFAGALTSVGSAEKLVAPGTAGTFDLQLVNQGTVRDEFTITRGSIRPGWSVSFSETEIDLDPGQRAEVTAAVRTSPEEPIDAEFDVETRAQSAGDPQVVGNQTLRIVIGERVDFDVRLVARDIAGDADPDVEVGEDSSTVRLRALLHHDSNFRDTYGLAVTDHDNGGTLTFQPTAIALDPGQIGEFEARYGTDALQPNNPAVNPPELGCSPGTVLDYTLHVVPDSQPDKAKNIPFDIRCTLDQRTNEVVLDARSKPSSENTIEIEDFKKVNPGRQLKMPIRVTHTGVFEPEDPPYQSQRPTLTVNYTASVSTAPDGWDVDLLDNNLSRVVEVGSRDCRKIQVSDAGCEPYWDTLTLNVTIPTDARAGLHEIVVAASSRERPIATAEHTYTVEVVPQRNASVQVPEAATVTEPGEPAVYTVAVVNGGNVPERLDVDVNVSGLPGTWEAAQSRDDVRVPPGSTRYVTFKIRPAQDAATGSRGTMDVTVGTAFGIVHRFNLTATVLGADEIGLSADRTRGQAKAGQATSFDVTVTNDGARPVAANLSTVPLPDGFDATLRRNGQVIRRVQLDPGASIDVDLEVEVPEGALANDTVGVLVLAQAGSTTVSSLDLTVDILQTTSVQLDPDRRRAVTPAGQPVDYTVEVRNTGTGRDTFVLQLSPETASPGWSTALSRTSVTLRPKAATSILVTVFPTEQIPAGTTELTRLQAISMKNPTTRSLVTLNTTTLLRQAAIGDGNASAALAPGETRTVDAPLINRGNAEDTFVVEVTDTPPGWKADDSAARRTLAAGASGGVPLQVTTPVEVQEGIYSLDLRVRSTLDPSVTATGSVLVRVPPSAARDVDDDGFMERAVDRNGESSDGMEAFTEITTDQGIETRVVAQAAFGDTVRSGFVLQVRTDPSPKHRFWDPGSDVLTDVEVSDLFGATASGYFVDVDDDGNVDFVYDDTDERVLPAVGIRGRQAFLVDTDGDGRMDLYHSTDRGLSTPASHHLGDEVSVDTDGDGSFDGIVDERTGQFRAFTMMDSASKAAVDFWYVVILLVVAVVLAPAVYWIRVRSTEVDAE